MYLLYIINEFGRGESISYYVEVLVAISCLGYHCTTFHLLNRQHDPGKGMAYLQAP